MTWEFLIKHGEGFGLPILPTNEVERVWAGLGPVKANHEKGFGCFMIPRSWAGRVWRRFDAQLLVVEVSWEKVTQRFYVFRGTLQMTLDI